MVRVIAGTAKGRLLTAPKGMDTRPITSKIKEALFNIWQTQIVDASFLDLFAGSGSMGIEALSRGAKDVVFVEKDRRAVNVIKRNLSICNFNGKYEVFQDDVFRRIMWLKERQRIFDIIYLDPPFTVDKIFLPVLNTLSDAGIFAEKGILAIRTKKEKELPGLIGALELFKTKIYGISKVQFYRRTEIL